MYLARLLLSIMLLFKHLAGIFAIETLGCVGMANHMHFVIRTRPDVALAWRDDETAVRCWMLFPQRRLAAGPADCPAPEEQDRIKNSSAGLAGKRRRLTNRGCLLMSLDEYLQLVDRTGRHLRRVEAVSAPAFSTAYFPSLKISHLPLIPPFT